ncbi:hypothetical protein V8E53_013282 [Lactarius tabidus]
MCRKVFMKLAGKYFNEGVAGSVRSVRVTIAITLTLLVRSIGSVFFSIAPVLFRPTWYQLRPDLPAVHRCAVPFWYSDGRRVRSTIVHRALKSPRRSARARLRRAARGIHRRLPHFLNLLRAQYGYRELFWTTLCISAFTACIHALVPESGVFLRAKAQERAAGASTGQKTKVFMHRVGLMLIQHRAPCIYAVLLMTGVNFLSHGSQDLHPTYFKMSKGFSNRQIRHAIIATIIGNYGAITCPSLTLSTI